MKPFSYHNHADFCDGKNTVEEIVLSAIDHGFDSVGISCHSYISPIDTYCMDQDKHGEYLREVRRVKDKYKDRISVYVGIEQDTLSDPEKYRQGYDYKIGSVHSVRRDGKRFDIDNTEEIMLMGVRELCGGDIYEYCELYFEEMEHVFDITGCDIVGHFDLVTKFNEGGRLFDEDNERYITAAEKAIKKLVSQGLIFEINTGAMSRGKRTSPYPSKRLLEIIKREGGKITYSSDCHLAKDISCAFDEAASLAKECGFEGFMKLTSDGFKLEAFDKIKI